MKGFSHLSLTFLNTSSVTSTELSSIQQCGVPVIKVSSGLQSILSYCLSFSQSYLEGHQPMSVSYLLRY